MFFQVWVTCLVKIWLLTLYFALYSIRILSNVYVQVYFFNCRNNTLHIDRGLFRGGSNSIKWIWCFLFSFRLPPPARSEVRFLRKISCSWKRMEVQLSRMTPHKNIKLISLIKTAKFAQVTVKYSIYQYIILSNEIKPALDYVKTCNF